MENSIDGIKNFFNTIKNLNFWKRVFRWSQIKIMLIDAAADLQRILSENESFINTNQKLDRDLSTSAKDLESAKNQINELKIEKARLSQINQEDIKKLEELSSKTTQVENLAKRNSELQSELAIQKEKVSNLDRDLKDVKQKNIQFESNEQRRREEHSNSIASLSEIKKQIEDERRKELEEENRVEIERLGRLKETWSEHQGNIKNTIKYICTKHIIEYVEKVPFKGEPDNTLNICGEHVIFDAKSPAGDDLENFPHYLKDQAEKAKKYAKQENVKKDIFFVVPSNTLEILPLHVINLADYDVYIISMDSLEPIILNLKKIENYEFAEQLSPEDRDNICRILGKFAHLTKRRIQIDSYFAKQAIELAYKSEADLPKEVLEGVIKFERSEKLNPPQEKRIKSIDIKELEKDSKKLIHEAAARGIVIEDQSIEKSISEIPLYKAD